MNGDDAIFVGLCRRTMIASEDDQQQLGLVKVDQSIRLTVDTWETKVRRGFSDRECLYFLGQKIYFAPPASDSKSDESDEYDEPFHLRCSLAEDYGIGCG
jgi:hypothetical protein